MPSLSQSIIVNVEEKYIENYLKKKGFTRTEDENADCLLKRSPVPYLTVTPSHNRRSA